MCSLAPKGDPEERTMTVSELMRLLEDGDPEAEVRIMSQQSWPFENAIAGVGPARVPHG